MTLAAFVAVSVIFVAAAWFLAYHRANGLAWSFWLAAGVGALHISGAMHPAAVVALWAVVAIFAVFTILIPVRRAVITGPIFGSTRRSCRRSRKPSRKRSTPAVSGGTRISSPATPSGRSSWPIRR